MRDPPSCQDGVHYRELDEMLIAGCDQHKREYRREVRTRWFQQQAAAAVPRTNALVFPGQNIQGFEQGRGGGLAVGWGDRRRRELARAFRPRYRIIWRDCLLEYERRRDDAPGGSPSAWILPFAVPPFVLLLLPHIASWCAGEVCPERAMLGAESQPVQREGISGWSRRRRCLIRGVVEDVGEEKASLPVRAPVIH